MHEVGAVDSAKADVSGSEDNEQEKTTEKLSRKSVTEKENPLNNSITEENDSGVGPDLDEDILLWSSKVEQGLALPDKSDKIELESFKKSWRSWYQQSINIDAKASTRQRNKERYEYGKKHMEKIGYEVTENENTGRVRLVKRDNKLYDFSGRELSDNELRNSVGITSGWTEYEFVNE